jgi:hypothetical protein
MLSRLNLGRKMSKHKAEVLEVPRMKRYPN